MQRFLVGGRGSTGEKGASISESARSVCVSTSSMHLAGPTLLIEESGPTALIGESNLFGKISVPRTECSLMFDDLSTTRLIHPEMA